MDFYPEKSSGNVGDQGDSCQQQTVLDIGDRSKTVEITQKPTRTHMPFLYAVQPIVLLLMQWAKVSALFQAEVRRSDDISTESSYYIYDRSLATHAAMHAPLRFECLARKNGKLRYSCSKKNPITFRQVCYEPRMTKGPLI